MPVVTSSSSRELNEKVAPQPRIGTLPSFTWIVEHEGEGLMVSKVEF